MASGFRSPQRLNSKSQPAQKITTTIEHETEVIQPTHQAMPSDEHVSSGIDQAEAHTNDPANASQSSAPGQSSAGTQSSPSNQSTSNATKPGANKNIDAPLGGTKQQASGGGAKEGTGGAKTGLDGGGGMPSYPGGMAGMAGAMRGARAFFSQHKKQSGIVGAIIALITTLIFGGGGLAVFKLVHIREVMNQYFGNRMDHMVERRIGNNWRVVADKDGNVTYEKTGHPLRDHLYNTKSAKVVADLKTRGLDIKLDPTTHKIMFGDNYLANVLAEQGSGTKLANQRDFIREQLKEAYPGEGFLRRSIRAQRVFKIYGIRRVFFENSREKVDDWEKEMRKRIRERLFGAATEDATIKASVPDAAKDTPTAKALEDMEKELGDKANTLRQDAIDHPEHLVEDVDLEVTPEEMIKGGGTAAVKGAFNATQWLSDICHVKNLMTEIRIAAAIYRERSLARYAGTILVAADQLKEGKNVDGTQINALMLTLTEIEKSGGFQRASGTNPSAVLTTAPKYSLDLTKNDGAGGFFAKFSKDLDTFAGSPGKEVCKVATNFIFQIVSTIGTITADIFTAGGVSVVGLGTGAAVSTTMYMAEKILVPMAIQTLAGMAVTGDEPSKDRGDAIFGGSDVIYNAMARQNGGRKLSTKEAAELDRTIAAERDAEDKQKGIGWRLFNLDNPRSMMARVAFGTPATPQEAASQFNNYVARINPFTAFSSVIQPNGLLARLSGTADAEAVAQLDDPLGISQVGLTDSELGKFPDVVANEDWLYESQDRLQDYTDFEQKCLIGPVVDEENEKLCNSTDDTHLRYRIYHLDKGIAGGIDYVSGSTDQLPDDDQDNSAAPAPVSGGLPASGDMKTLAAQVKANPRITYTTSDARHIMDLAAEGKQVPVACKGTTTELSPALLRLMLALSAKYSFGVGYITNGCHSASSIHYVGGAMDINTINGKEANGTGSLDHQFAQDTVNLESQLNLNGAGIGQKQCMAALDLPPNIRHFDDTCNHIHVDVGHNR